MNLCQNIETLAMAYLDDELVVEERRELELHMLACVACKAHFDAERADLSFVRKALVAPPAPDLFKARIARALDQEDREAARVTRKRFGAWLLPGAAMVAAAAAIVAFVAIRSPASREGTGSNIAQGAVRAQNRSLPLEVQGASTGPWLRRHFKPIAEPPTFRAPGIQMLGARLMEISGHEAALVHYNVVIGQNRFRLQALLIDDLQPDDLSGGEPLRVGDRTVHLYNADGHPAVTYVDDMGMGYAFTSERLTAQELLQLVVTTDLIGRAQRKQ
jgi:anti-sigma factor RsiW